MSRYKLNFNRPKLSEQEINQQMNFDEFSKNIPTQSSILKIVKSSKWFAAVTASVLLVASFFAYRHLHSSRNDSDSLFINPPVAEANVAYESFTVNTAFDTTLIYKTGSCINVPKGIFVDKDGNEAEGNIELRYREFHDPFEVILSGIPMHYDSAGVRYQFESAGMMEILAFKKGEALQIKPGKSLGINMVSHTTADNFNLYYLDTVQRRWEYVSENSKANNSNIPLYDTSLHREYAEKMNTIMEPVLPGRANSNNSCFTIDYKKDEFPELAMYGDIQFEVKESETNYNPSLAKKIWEDVSIEKAEKGFYKVTFSTEAESHSFNAIPVVEGKDYEEAKKEYDAKMNEYRIALKSRQGEGIQAEDIIRSNYEKYMAESRWEDLNTRVNKFVKSDYVNYRRLAIRTFQITGVGLWNYDVPTRFTNPLALKATFYENNNKTLNSNLLYLIVKNKNLLYPFSIRDNGTCDFKCEKGEDCLLLSITKDGFPAYLNADEFKKAINKSEKVDFRMHVYDKKVKDAQELKKLFDL